MSYILSLLAVLAQSSNVRLTSITTYDDLVQLFDANLVSYWKFANTGADQNGTENATIIGNPETSVPSIVDLDVLSEGAPTDGVCIAWPGTTAEYAQAAHNAAHKTATGTIIVTHQHDTFSVKSTLVAADASDAAGGCAVEVNTNGSARAFLRDASGVPIVLTGVAGDIQIGQAYTTVFKWGGGGLSLALWGDSGNLIRRVTNASTAGLSGTSPIRFGLWHTGVSPHEGPYGRVIWLNARISDADEAILARAKTIQRSSQSVITTTSIYMWKTDRDVGERKITDTASGGTISSPGGGTLPAFPITVDPTPYVSGAVGTKSGWTAQFRNSTKGTWTRIASGDFQFTPGATAGEDNSEYRVSDDGGSTWSAWTSLVSMVIDRALTPGPYFCIEDYAGSNDAKLIAARDAAVAAGGGTVTTRNRATVYDGLHEHQAKARVHYLGLRLKRKNMSHSTYGECKSSGAGPGTGWDEDWQAAMIDGETNAGSIVSSGVRHAVSCCYLDGNNFKQALHQASPDGVVAASEYGKCWPGARNNAACFNLQLMRLVKIRGNTASGAGNRAKWGFYGTDFRNNVADGIQCVGAGDADVHDCRFEGCFRGGLVFDFGNTVLNAQRNTYVTGAGNIGCGIDHEMIGFGDEPTRYYQALTHTDDFINADFDFIITGASVHQFNGCVIGPALEIMVKFAAAAPGVSVTWQGSAAHPRGTIRYHRKAPGPAGGEYPRCSIFGWGGQGPHHGTFKFIDQDFQTWGGGTYVYHEGVITPGAGETWTIELGQTLDTTAQHVVWLVNCTAGVGAGTPSGTYRLFNTVTALTTTQIVRLDGLTIASGFAQDAVRLSGQRLEYRNVTHQGFPGATISQICPGAGQYVAL